MQMKRFSIDRCATNRCWSVMRTKLGIDKRRISSSRHPSTTDNNNNKLHLYVTDDDQWWPHTRTHTHTYPRNAISNSSNDTAATIDRNADAVLIVCRLSATDCCRIYWWQKRTTLALLVGLSGVVTTTAKMIFSPSGFFESHKTKQNSHSQVVENKGSVSPTCACSISICSSFASRHWWDSRMCVCTYTHFAANSPDHTMRYLSSFR